jgi:hypothetical protein
MIEPDIFRENISRIQQGEKIQQNFRVSAATLAMGQTTSVFSRQQSNAAWEQPPQLQNFTKKNELSCAYVKSKQSAMRFQ